MLLSKDTCRTIFAFFVDPINLRFFVITSRTFSLSQELSGESETPSVRPTVATITQERDDAVIPLSTKHKAALVTVAINCRKTQ